MIKTIILVAVLAAFGIAHGEEIMRLPELTTKAGKKYSSVVVTAKRPDGISITFADGGLARIPGEQIPDDLAKRLGGFTPPQEHPFFRPPAPDPKTTPLVDAPYANPPKPAYQPSGNFHSDPPRSAPTYAPSPQSAQPASGANDVKGIGFGVVVLGGFFVIFIVKAAHFLRPPRCGSCGAEIKRTSHAYVVNGKKMAFCPSCARIVQNRVSRDAVKSLLG